MRSCLPCGPKKPPQATVTPRTISVPDILFDLGQKKTHQFLVGFAAETNDVIAHGRNKVERKNLDMLIANNVAMPGAGFNVTTNIAAILYKDGTLQQYPKMAKEELGKIIIEKIAEKCN